MADSKKYRNIDEDIIRYIYNSRFFPERLIDKESEYARSLSYNDDELFKIIDGAKSFKEARNLLIDGLKNEETLARVRDAARAYSSAYEDPNNSFDPDKSFLTPLERVPLNVESLPYDYVESRGNDIARALKYTNGINGMIADMNSRNKITDMLGQKSGDEYRNHIAKEILERLNSDGIDKAVLLDSLDLTPNADNEYIARKASEYAERVNRKKNHEKMGSIARGVQSILFPYTEQKSSEGFVPNGVDAVTDLLTIAAPMAGATKYGKASKELTALEKLVNTADNPRMRTIGKLLGLSGMGAIAGGVEPFITRGHDAIDALMSKNVYANEGENNEVSEQKNVEDALRLETLLSDVKDGVESGLMASAVGIGGRYGKQALKNVADKVADSKIGKKFVNGFDALFGSKKDAVNSGRKLQKEKKAIQDEIDDFYGNPKSTVSDEAHIMNQRRLEEIADEEEAIRKRYLNSAANKAQTAIDALTAFTVMKAGINPGMNAREALKKAYAIDFLIGGD